MVSPRCKMLVKTELDKLNIPYSQIELGEVSFNKKLNKETHDAFQQSLGGTGLEIIENKKEQLVEAVKTVVIKMIHYSEELPLLNYSSYIGSELGYNYTYLANVFSEIEGITIEHFIISNKIERVKELMKYNEFNLTEISYKMNYSSVAHLSNQFKKVTGLTPSAYKIKINHRQSLDKI